MGTTGERIAVLMSQRTRKARNVARDPRVVIGIPGQVIDHVHVRTDGEPDLPNQMCAELVRIGEQERLARPRPGVQPAEVSPSTTS